eukprot:CAMPEP_0196590888 /NCGR_PEP_ID=MMETSP1081-20130531/67893_1 /TAXON_ID=36882 /ORGANISM="Pyramimonas amylifera, Strain CCMP720" /LENGTH=81 /DNA_ID=CAMNT_0041914111 /DNA_START=268 /DNA_END=513 /DNA_ORIENTATION=+
MYDDDETYVLLAPGEEEKFVSTEELSAELEKMLLDWEDEWPQDLLKFKDASSAANYLMESACELDLGGALGSLQWYQVRLD